MRYRWGALAGLVFAVGCVAPDPGPAPVSQPIINGAPHTGDPAIMALLSFRGQQGARCTATLITPRLLLAAAHCLTETPGYERQVFTGNNDGNGTSKDMLVVKSVVHDTRYGRPRQGFDFSIIELVAPLPIKPVPLNRAPLEGAVGKTVRYVGYGIVAVGNLGSGGVKRQNTAPLADVSRLLLMIGPNPNQTCEGDSGGPLLMDTGKGEAIIGVGSFVDAPACRNNAYYQRIDTQIAWIDEQIQKLDPGGMAPAADAGVAPEAASLLPDAGPAETGPAPTPPPPADARAPEAGTTPPPPAPTPDAREPARPPTSQPPPQPTSTGATGGCRQSPGGPPPAGGPGLAAVLLACAWLGRRRRR